MKFPIPGPFNVCARRLCKRSLNFQIRTHVRIEMRRGKQRLHCVVDWRGVEVATIAMPGAVQWTAFQTLKWLAWSSRAPLQGLKQGLKQVVLEEHRSRAVRSPCLSAMRRLSWPFYLPALVETVG